MTSIEYQRNPMAFARDLLGFVPDDSQRPLLETAERQVILNCHRQWGKTTVTAVRAVHRAATRPKQAIVIVSPTMRQSRLLANRCREFGNRLGVTLGTDGTNARSVVFPNGSTILPLPAHPDRVRGFTADFLIFDEAARVADEVYAAATPMLATTEGDLWLLSTPRGRGGFFYEEWMSQEAKSKWLRLEGKIAQSGGRLDAEFLRRERGRKTAEQFAEEYNCSFVTAERNIFLDEWLERSFTADFGPFAELSREDLRFEKYRPAYYLAFDPGKMRDHSAIVLIEFRVIPTGTRDTVTYLPLYRRELRVVLAEQFRLKTAHRAVIDRLSKLCNHPHLAHHTQLLVDGTGKGEPVEEMCREAKLPVSLLPLTITPGGKESVSSNWRTVPKANLVANLEYLLERGNLRISNAIPQGDLLRNELRHFERKSRRGGSVKYEAGSGHDDLVMALAMAAWWAWKHRKGWLTGGEVRTLA
ncbi:MAG: terminase family protein [Bryobacteraceae bacterium]|nr:terminase family protein [Bryobacteraceae bacterium]